MLSYSNRTRESPEPVHAEGGGLKTGLEQQDLGRGFGYPCGHIKLHVRQDSFEEQPGPGREVYSAAATGNSKTTSFPVRRRYTDVNESSLCSIFVESLLSSRLWVGQGQYRLESGERGGRDGHFEEFRAVDGDACAFADDLGGVHEILEDLLVDGGEGAAAGALLLDARGPGGFAEHPALGDEHDMAIGELLLQLARESATNRVSSGSPVPWGGEPHTSPARVCTA